MRLEIYVKLTSFFQAGEGNVHKKQNIAADTSYHHVGTYNDLMKPIDSFVN